ncbi:MAG: hypothetical protein RJQ07_09890 [Pseudomonadales bacterium]
MSDSNATTRCFACMAGCGDRQLERGPVPAGLLPSAVWLFGLPLLALSCAVVAADWYALAPLSALALCSVAVTCSFVGVVQRGRRLEAMVIARG